MAKRLRSVGVDVGTTTTQLIVSELTVENRASGFCVPRLEIAERKILYQSPIYFTPLLGGELVDGQAIRRIVAAEYEKAGISRESVDTGAIIITGETSRKENARAVVHALADFAGDFVVATAGPDLESMLAARGAGAVAFSARTGKRVLHMDIGGGTSNLALIDDGKILSVTCLNVGGRLMKFDDQGRITYLSPVLRGRVPWREGDTLSREQAMEVARELAAVLEAAAGLGGEAPLEAFLTREASGGWQRPAGVLLSFSGGVADCIERAVPWLEYGDLGPLLGQAIRQSALCRGEYRLGSQTIRATVIGAGCHSTQLSGSTVFCRNAALPLKNLPVAAVSGPEQELPREELARLIRKRLESLERWGVLALPGYQAAGYDRVVALAEAIAQAVGDRGAYLAVEADMAKALGQALALRLKDGCPCLCLDGLAPQPGSYLDVAAPVGPAFPVVIKTLILAGEEGAQL